jgi:sigma-B regulation protein RsbU (phosphoserine phosphatase)
LTDHSAEPLPKQISRQILEKILSGELAAGSALPSARLVARQHQLSANTVLRAYEELEKIGVISVSDRAAEQALVNALSIEKSQALRQQQTNNTEASLKMFQSFSRQLLSVFEPAKLREVLAENLKKSLAVAAVHVVLREENGGAFALLPSEGEPGPIAIAPHDEMLRAISHLQTPAAWPELECSPNTSALRDELKRRGTDLIVPLREADHFLGFIGLSLDFSGLSLATHEMNLLVVLASQFVSALLASRLYVEAVEKRRMENELAIARQIQADLLPKTLPDDECVQIAAFSEPSRAVGGDFYDYLPIDDRRFGLVIADACGKGMPAAMLISQIQVILKTEVRHQRAMMDTVTQLNKHVKRHAAPRNFVTLVYGIFDRATRQFEYVNAGHNHPMLLRRNGNAEELHTTGPALGLMPNGRFQTALVTVQPGDALVFYTDGITEIMNNSAEQYGEQRLLQLAQQYRESEARALLTALRDDVKAFYPASFLPDDRTLMILKMNESD